MVGVCVPYRESCVSVWERVGFGTHPQWANNGDQFVLWMFERGEKCSPHTGVTWCPSPAGCHSVASNEAKMNWNTTSASHPWFSITAVMVNRLTWTHTHHKTRRCRWLQSARRRGSMSLPQSGPTTWRRRFLPIRNRRRKRWRGSVSLSIRLIYIRDRVSLSSWSSTMLASHSRWWRRRVKWGRWTPRWRAWTVLCVCAETWIHRWVPWSPTPSLPSAADDKHEEIS